MRQEEVVEDVAQRCPARTAAGVSTWLERQTYSKQQTAEDWEVPQNYHRSNAGGWGARFGLSVGVSLLHMTNARGWVATALTEGPCQPRRASNIDGSGAGSSLRRRPYGSRAEDHTV